MNVGSIAQCEVEVELIFFIWDFFFSLAKLVSLKAATAWPLLQMHGCAP